MRSALRIGVGGLPSALRVRIGRSAKGGAVLRLRVSTIRIAIRILIAIRVAIGVTVGIALSVGITIRIALLTVLLAVGVVVAVGIAKRVLLLVIAKRRCRTESSACKKFFRSGVVSYHEEENTV